MPQNNLNFNLQLSSPSIRWYIFSFSSSLVWQEFSLPSITLFERCGLRGKRVILTDGTVNLQLAGGCNRVQSVLVEGGMWVHYNCCVVARPVWKWSGCQSSPKFSFWCDFDRFMHNSLCLYVSGGGNPFCCHKPFFFCQVHMKQNIDLYFLHTLVLVSSQQISPGCLLISFESLWNLNWSTAKSMCQIFY